MLFSRRWLFLMELVALNQRVPGSSPVSPPAFASPTIFAFEACACSRMKRSPTNSVDAERCSIVCFLTGGPIADNTDKKIICAVLENGHTVNRLASGP